MIFEFLKQRKTLIVRAFLIFLSLWVIFLALFPFILSKGLLESQINKKINGNLAIGKSKLSWFRDQRFEDIKLSDVDGQTIVSIKSIKTSLSLLDLISGKNDFKQTSIDGLIGNIFASRGLPTNLTTSLNTTSFVQAQNTKSRAHPAFIFKKPFSGDFHIDNSSFLIQSQEHDPIYFKDIQFSCTLFKQRKSVIAHLACETSQNNLSGAVDLKLEMGGFDEKGQLIITPLDKEIFFLSPEGYINLGAQVTNLPSQGIDHLLRLYNPNLSQIFSNATGGPLTLKANLHVLKDKSKIQLSVDANDLKVQFAGALQQNQFFLTEPSTARLRIRPAFIANVSQAISSKLTLSINEATDALIQIDRLTTPLDLSNFNFNNLSCNAQFSLSPMKFLGDKRFSSFEIKQIKGTIDTFDLNENLTLHLNALAYEDNKPIHLKLDGELTKLIDNQMELLGIDQVKAHFIAQAKDFPTKLVLTLFKNKSLATELLGPTLNIDSTIKGSLQSADIALAFNSSRLNIPEMSWKLKDKKHFILSSPSTVELRATPVLAQKAMSPKLSILHPFLLTGKLNQCEFFINQKQMQLQALDLNLDSASFDFILSDYKPCHVNESSAHFCSSAGSNVELLLSTQVDLPSDLPFYQLDKSIASTFKLNDFLAYLKGSPCQVQTDFKAPNWTVSLNGYADRHWNYELMQEATLSMNNPAFLPSTQSVIESPRITLQINPCSINLLDLNFSTLNLNGKFSADNLNLSSDSFTHTFKNFSAVFEYCGQANYLKLTAKSDQVLENVSLVCESLLQSGRLNFADAKYNFAADVKKLPPNIFKIITPYTYDYESILGPTLDLSISSNFQKNDSINGIISYELSSSILHSKGNFSIGNKIQSGDQCIELDYFMSPAGYFAVSRALKKDLDSTLFLEEPLHLKAHINKLSKNIPKHLNDFQLSFDGNFSVDKFVSNKGSLFDLYGSFNTSDITQNLKLDLSASTNNSEGEKGGAYLSAEFTEPFNATTATINHKINGFINCQLEHFPTAILHDFISFNSPQLPSLPQLLGSSFNMNCTANLESGRGPLQFELNSINLNSRFALNFEKDHVTLDKDLKAQLNLSTDESRLWLQKINPLFLSAQLDNTSIKITVPKNNFYLPVTPFSAQDVNIECATLEVEKLKLEPNPNLNKLMALLKAPSSHSLDIWLTPICFSLHKGIVSTKRLDFLINDAHHIAFWGDYSIPRNKGSFYLALTQETLKKTLGFTQLPQNFLFQIPLYGDLNALQADWATATAQLCLLGATTSLSNSSQGLSQVLDLFAKSAPSQSIPQNNFPLPWKENLPLSQKPHQKNVLPDSEQSEILHTFFSDLRKTLNK